jgi:UDP-glucose 4-epimerase
MAANADIKDNFREPRKCIDQNMVVTQNVLEAMRAAGTKEIAFASTGSVYGDGEDPHARGRAVPRADVDLRELEDRRRGPAHVVRADRRPGARLQGRGSSASSRSWALATPTATSTTSGASSRPTPRGSQVLGDGKQEKSYLHVADCVGAMMLAIAKSRDAINIFNLGHSEALKVDDSVGIISRTMKVSPRIEHTGGERGWPGDERRIQLDTSRIRALGWAPTRTIEQSVVETLEFLVANPAVERRSMLPPRG